MTKKKEIDNYITQCTLTFKAFDHEVTVTKSKANLWNFTTTSKYSGKKYAVYCAPDMKKVKSLIKIALKKLPKDTRLVVVTNSADDTQKADAETQGYTIVELGTLSRYGEEMLDIKSTGKSREGTEEEQISSQIEKVLGDDPIEKDDILDEFMEKEKLF